MHREHRAQVLVRFLEGPGAVVVLILHVGLRHAEIELAGLDRVDVVDGAAGRLDRAAQAVLGAVLVDEPADGAADRVIDAGDAAGADGDELLLRSGGQWCGKHAGEGDPRCGGNGAAKASGLRLHLMHGGSPPQGEATVPRQARESRQEAARFVTGGAAHAEAGQRVAGHADELGVVGGDRARRQLQVVLEADAHVPSQQRRGGYALHLGRTERADRPAPARRQRREHRQEVGRAAGAALDVRTEDEQHLRHALRNRAIPLKAHAATRLVGRINDVLDERIAGSQTGEEGRGLLRSAPGRQKARGLRPRAPRARARRCMPSARPVRSGRPTRS